MTRILRRVGHAALRVTDLDAAVEHAVQICGQREVERRDGVSYLTCNELHHTLQLIQSDRVGLDHIALEATGPEAIEELADIVRREGLEVVAERPEEIGLAHAIRFVGAGGFVFEVFAGMEEGQPHSNGPGVRPRRFGHHTLLCEDLDEMQSFLERVLGFQLSDRMGGEMIWMRCDTDHHGIAVLRRGRNQFHHHAWELENWAEIERICDHLFRNGRTVLWGPGRHGPGNNLFCYHLDPFGICVEYIADLERFDETNPRAALDWPVTPTTINRWGPAPPENFLDVGVDVLAPAAAAA